MLKDIEIEPVKDVGVAVVKEKNAEGEDIFNVYLINNKSEDITGVLVSSKGYGEIEGEKRSSSALRHFLDTVEGPGYKIIEPIVEEVFNLTNEYWVSFFHDNKMLDKKFLFVPGSVDESNFVTVPVLGKKGIIIL